MLKLYMEGCALTGANKTVHLKKTQLLILPM